MQNYILGIFSGILLSFIVMIIAFWVKKDIKNTVNTVKKAVNGKATFLEPEELTEKINRFFTK